MKTGEKIRALRERADMTLEELGRLCGTTRQTIYKYENLVVTNIPTDRLETIAKALNTTPAYLMGWDETPEGAIELSENDFIELPVIGSIAAGYNGEAIEEETGEKLKIPRVLLHGRPESDFMVLQVKGDSMSPQLLDGDKVIVLRCTSVDSGSIAVIMYDGWDATIKKVQYVKGEDWLEMVPINPKYQTKRIEGADLQECRVLGKVVDLIRHFD